MQNLFDTVFGYFLLDMSINLEQKFSEHVAFFRNIINAYNMYFKLKLN